jgi:hypothetical protein
MRQLVRRVTVLTKIAPCRLPRPTLSSPAILAAKLKPEPEPEPELELESEPARPGDRSGGNHPSNGTFLPTRERLSARSRQLSLIRKQPTFS